MVSHPDLLVGIETGDDAAVYRLDEKTAIIVTVDFFTPITDDPYEFGSVAAANSLSDVYAMGGKPLVALNVVGFPADLAVEMLGDVLKGGYDKATEAGCLIVGGHRWMTQSQSTVSRWSAWSSPEKRSPTPTPSPAMS